MPLDTEWDSARKRAEAILASLELRGSSHEVHEAFAELDELPEGVVRDAMAERFGPLPDPEQLDDVLRRGIGMPPRPLHLRTVMVTYDADVFDLGPTADAQLRAAGIYWDGVDRAPEERLDDEVEGSFAGTLQRRVLVEEGDSAAVPRFDVLLFAEGAGLVFRANTLDVVAAIADSKVEMRDRRCRLALQRVLFEEPLPEFPAPPESAPFEFEASESEPSEVALAASEPVDVEPASAEPIEHERAASATAMTATTTAATARDSADAATSTAATASAAGERVAAKTVKKSAGQKTAAKAAKTKAPQDAAAAGVTRDKTAASAQKTSAKPPKKKATAETPKKKAATAKRATLAKATAGAAKKTAAKTAKKSAATSPKAPKATAKAPKKASTPPASPKKKTVKKTASKKSPR